MENNGWGHSRSQKLGLDLSEDSQFFIEWLEQLPGLIDTEQQRVEQVRRNDLYQVESVLLAYEMGVEGENCDLLEVSIKFS
jgi:hypothetical protein